MFICLLKNLLNSIIMKKNIEVFTMNTFLFLAVVIPHHTDYQTNPYFSS